MPRSLLDGQHFIEYHVFVMYINGNTTKKNWLVFKNLIGIKKLFVN